MFIRQVFHLPLRHEGFMNSLARVMKAEITIPNFSSISKRSITLPKHILTKVMESGSLVIVDCTGLKVYGKDEWHHESTCAATAKNGSMDQCVCTQQNDKSGHACVRKNLTNARNGELWPNFDLFNNAIQS
jgi:Transposase DDE domain